MLRAAMSDSREEQRAAMSDSREDHKAQEKHS